MANSLNTNWLDNYAKVVKGKVTGEIVYLNAMDEELYNIAHASNPYGKTGKFDNEIVEARIKTKPGIRYCRGG